VKTVELPHQGAWLVYLNGLLVPCPSVSVSYGVGVIPEATLSFPPHRLLQRLGTEDKIEVVVFYLDDLAEPTKPEFRLLFEGEIAGWSYTSSTSGRQITFNAIADISIFTQLHFFFLNNVDTLAANVVKEGGSQSVEGVDQAGAVFPFSLFKKGLLIREPLKLTDPPQPDVTRPFEIIYNVVRGMLDHELSPARRAVPSIGFFSRWARKRNFQNRFAALPIFEDPDPTIGTSQVFPILEAAQATAAMKAMQDNLATDIGDAGTMMEVLNGIFGTVYFEISMLPTAACARVRLSDGQVLGPSNSDPSNRDAPELEPLRILNYMVKPQFRFGIPPTCNVMFPSMITNYSYAENYLVQPTRTYVNDTFISQVLAQNVFTTSALTFGFPEEVDVVLREKMSQAQAAATAAKNAGVGPSPGNQTHSGKNVLLFPEEQFKGPLIHRMSIPSWFTYLKNKEPPTADSPAAVEESRAIHQLMQSYVSYEHFRARYEKRGGAVNMAWNPYVVPGHPCVVFDQAASAFHTVGYLQNVQQSLSLEGMTTAINYSSARTIPEMLDLLQSELVKNPGKIFGSAPLEPIVAIRDIIQDFTKAEQFYNALFFQRTTLPPGGKKASFDFREVLGYDDGKGGADPIVLEAEPDSPTNGGGAGKLVTTTRVTNLVGDRNVVPLKGFDPVFANYDIAMRYIARPICSITDYVRFLHGEAPMSQLVVKTTALDGTTLNPQVETGDSAFGNTVTYFKRIKRLRQGPGAQPPPAALGVTGSGAAAAVFTGTNVGGPANFAQTRADWDTVLENYRAEMVNRQGPLE